MPVRLWADDSSDSRELIKKLEAKGYVVTHILTASEDPTLVDRNVWSWNYQVIHRRYLS